MTRSPTFSPAAETTTPPPTSDLTARRPSPPGPTLLALSWRHDHPYCPASLSPSRFLSICECQVDGAVPTQLTACGAALSPERVSAKGRNPPNAVIDLAMPL